MMLLKKRNVDQISTLDYKVLEYHKIREDDVWKVSFIKEITDVKYSQLEVIGFEYNEVEEILNFLCT